jgi:hypothetical protein
LEQARIKKIPKRKLKPKINWRKIFSLERIKKEKLLLKARGKIKKRMAKQRQDQKIGRLREERVEEILKRLKARGKIRDYLRVSQLSYADLIEGVDFIFIYIDNYYKIGKISVTGPRWEKKHLERHPKIPVLSIKEKERDRNIEKKILSIIKTKRNEGSF